jgi:hypothetical protein
MRFSCCILRFFFCSIQNKYPKQPKLSHLHVYPINGCYKKFFGIFQGSDLCLSMFFCVCDLANILMYELLLSVQNGHQPVKNSQVEKRKLFRRRLYCDEGLPCSFPPTVRMSNSFVLLKHTTTNFVLPVYMFFGLGIGMRCIEAPQRCLDETFLHQSGETAGAGGGGGGSDFLMGLNNFLMTF